MLVINCQFRGAVKTVCHDCEWMNYRQIYVNAMSEHKHRDDAIRVALVGRKRVGKDTVANMIDDLEGIRSERLAFADSLKEICDSLFMFSDAQMHGSEKEIVDEHWKITPREAFQIIGDAIRAVKHPVLTRGVNDPDSSISLFIRALERRFELMASSRLTIITDVRFKDELLWCKRNGFLTVYISRNTEVDDLHCSEDPDGLLAGMCDEGIVNDGDMDSLRDTVRELYTAYFAQDSACRNLRFKEVTSDE